jgi:hypothetical protein
MAISHSPRLLKAAIVAVSPLNPLARVTAFQYNPATLTRSLAAQMAGGEGEERVEALRFKGAPKESISLEIELDATDELETAAPIAVALGIHPRLSALEMLVYPSTATVIANTVLAALGTTEILPAPAPLTLFIWGAKRILPVRVTSFRITEEAFDVNLNPIRATVALELQVLSYNDLLVQSPGYHLFLAHQAAKETMATLGGAANLAGVLGSGLRLAV